jgi:hypothetical protein
MIDRSHELSEETRNNIYQAMMDVGIDPEGLPENEQPKDFTEATKYTVPHQDYGRYPVIDVVDFVTPQPTAEKLYSNQLVKMYVVKLFGSVPNPRTYQSWREKAGCNKSQLGMTFDQAARLTAIAKLKSIKKKYRHAEKQIDALAKKKSHQEEVRFFLDAAQWEMVLGRQLVASLASMGITVTTARLKRLIPKLSANKLYNLGKVAIALIKEDGFTN